MTEGEKADGELAIDSIVVATAKQASCDLEGEAVILNLETGLYHGLNAVGSRVWQLVQSPCSIGTIRDALLDEYEVDPTTCAADLLAVLGEMRAAGLIEVRSG